MKCSTIVAALTLVTCSTALLAQVPLATSGNTPPVAPKIPKDVTVHGDKRIDDYFWLRDRTNPAVIEYLRAEDNYTDAVMAPTQALKGYPVQGDGREDQGDRLERPLSGWRFLGRKIPRPATRIAVWAALAAVYAGWFSLGVHAQRGHTPTHLTLSEALISPPFLWWLFSSTVAFFPFGAGLDRETHSPGCDVAGARAASPVAKLRPPPSPRPRAGASSSKPSSRRPSWRAPIASSTGGYDLDVSHPRIRLPRLPQAFSGFRIAQLTDIHIGPFMTEQQIRRFVEIANAQKPDLIAITGDYVTWDPGTQQAVVAALAGLKAPFGVFGCLGNHEAWSGTEDSITHLFALAGIPILRGARTSISIGGEQFNLIGVDYGARRPMMVPHNKAFVRQYLHGVGRLHRYRRHQHPAQPQSQRPSTARPSWASISASRAIPTAASWPSNSSAPRSPPAASSRPTSPAGSDSPAASST